MARAKCAGAPPRPWISSAGAHFCRPVFHLSRSLALCQPHPRLARNPLLTGLKSVDSTYPLSRIYKRNSTRTIRAGYNFLHDFRHLRRPEHWRGGFRAPELSGGLNVSHAAPPAPFGRISFRRNPLKNTEL